MRKEYIMSVSEITNSIKLLLENQIGLISVEGEVSNFKPHYSGHKYFTLKDDGATISCTMWKNRTLNFELADGQRVVVTGTISVYPPRGAYQIDVIAITPSGIGDLYKAYEILKQKLQLKGYFDDNIKKELPTMPMNIGVSTSPTGAAVKDIFSTIKRRFPSATIYFHPTIVQGAAAAPDIVNAIKKLSQTPADVIIIGRGGGSIEDLWAYNTELVADAIYDCQLPIISAVGHETDFSIADFVADVRAATPTAAAELSTPTLQMDILDDIFSCQAYIIRTMSKMLEQQFNSLNTLAFSRYAKQITDEIHYNYQWFDNQTDSIQKDVSYKMKNIINEFESINIRLNAASPTAPLTRGYALIKAGSKYISNDESLINYKEFELIRQNESVIAQFSKVIEKELLK